MALHVILIACILACDCLSRGYSYFCSLLCATVEVGTRSLFSLEVFSARNIDKEPCAFEMGSCVFQHQLQKMFVQCALVSGSQVLSSHLNSIGVPAPLVSDA